MMICLLLTVCASDLLGIQELLFGLILTAHHISGHCSHGDLCCRALTHFHEEFNLEMTDFVDHRHAVFCVLFVGWALNF